MNICRQQQTVFIRIDDFSTRNDALLDLFFTNHPSLVQWQESLVTCFITNRETASPDEAMKYKIRGVDFALEMCVVLDIMTKIKVVMTNVQGSKCNLWYIVEALPHLVTELKAMSAQICDLNEWADVANLSEVLFPKTKKNGYDLVRMKFRNTTVIEGWLISSEKKKSSEWLSNSRDNRRDGIIMQLASVQPALKIRFQHSSLGPHSGKLYGTIKDIESHLWPEMVEYFLVFHKLIILLKDGIMALALEYFIAVLF